MTPEQEVYTNSVALEMQNSKIKTEEKVIKRGGMINYNIERTGFRDQ